MDGALSLPVVENRIKGPMSLNFRDSSLHVALTHALIDGLSVKSTINNFSKGSFKRKYIFENFYCLFLFKFDDDI